MNKAIIVTNFQKKNLRIEDNFDKIGKANFVRLALYAFQASEANKQSQALTSKDK